MAAFREVERLRAIQKYEGRVNIAINGDPCELTLSFSVADGRVSGSGVGSCSVYMPFVGSTEQRADATLTGSIDADGNVVATLNVRHATGGGTVTITGGVIPGVRNEFLGFVDGAAISANTSAPGECFDAGCCSGRPDGMLCHDDGDPCNAGVCKAGTCVAGEPECPGQECSYGTCYTKGACGDGFCDETETHASCARDCVSACYGSEALCKKELLEVTFAGTHNAHASTAYPEFYAKGINTNQTKTIEEQLDDGVRFLAIDFNDCSQLYERAGEVCLCHGPCELGERPAKEGLAELATWMRTNPREVVILDLELSAKVAPRVRDEFRRAGLLEYEYHLPEGTKKFRRTLGDMIKSGERLVIFSDHLFIPAGEHLLQTDYSLSLTDDRVCTSSGTYPSDEQFYQIEHTRSIGTATSLAQACINTVAYMQETAAECQAEAGRKINAFSVDFYESGKGPLEIVNILNGVEHVSTPYSDAGGCIHCRSDANCGSGQVCVAGFCASKGDNGTPCWEDRMCGSASCFAGFCAECNGSEDCGSAQVCVLGGCYDKAGIGVPCMADAQCESGICNGMCVECDSSSDCGSGKTCVAGFCAVKADNGVPCVADDQCKSGICNGMCMDCRTDAHCGSGKICAAGACTSKFDNGVPCYADSQCGSGHCAGLCVECTSNSHCPGTFGVCLVGACI